jgi:tRNA-uridine 2-sulfurtransferase
MPALYARMRLAPAETVLKRRKQPTSEMTRSPPNRLIAGISGGVDSAVAAMLLLEQGHAVEGLFMKNWDEDDGTEYCTAKADYDDARRVCEHLGIALNTANFAAEYWDNVFEYFLAEYRAGRTPNPDILCNREIKFKVFLDYAKALGAGAIATGHYVRGRVIAEHERVATSNDTGFRLLKGVDANKDQSYFLQSVPAAQLAQCLFPLGALTKTEVRELARRAGLHNHLRKDSTGICFIGERRFRDFLSRFVAAAPGPILDMRGRHIGEHHGLAYYTIGQRQGLGIGGQRLAREAPWYVVEKHLNDNALVVSQDEADLLSDWLLTPAVNWLLPAPALPLQCSARIRYRQPDQICDVEATADGCLRVSFAQPQRAVAPGQFVCLYDRDVCLGGGVIETCGRAAGTSAREQVA